MPCKCSGRPAQSISGRFLAQADGEETLIERGHLSELSRKSLAIELILASIEGSLETRDRRLPSFQDGEGKREVSISTLGDFDADHRRKGICRPWTQGWPNKWDHT